MSEESLYNAMVRHQIYLEGFKGYQGSRFSDTAKALEAEYKRRINDLEYATLDELTKAQLKQFINELKKTSRRLYDAYILKLVDELEEFMEADYELQDGILEDTTDEDTGYDNEEDKQPDSMWAGILNDPIPGVGSLLIPFLTGVGLASIVKLERLITQAWSNGQTKQELLQELVGVRDETKVKALVKKLENKNEQSTGRQNGSQKPPDAVPTSGGPADVNVPVAPPVGTVGGIVNRARQENQAAVNTAVQHIAQGISELLMRRRFNRYQWISVLDDRTTSICRERNLRIYNFGAGPLPPAHINCRSHIVPYSGE